MNKDITRAKWSAGIAMIVVIGILILGSKVANADTRIVSTGIMKHIVVTEIPDGHITYSYRMDKDGKLILMDTLVTYKGMAMNVDQYSQYTKAEAKIEDAIAKVQKEVDMVREELDALEQGQCNNPLTIAP
jgi:hypothetical protein